jgi:uncharacterized protein (TIGR04255 family)
MGEILRKKPLIEAIFELKWELPSQQGGILIDPNYSFLVGLYYERIKDKYPFRNDLPASKVPVEVLPYIAQFQFRKGDNQWPLTQIGPGILSVNDTTGYSWENNFNTRCTNLIRIFKECYPENNKLKIIELHLRYINAVEFDYSLNDIYTYLSEYLNFNISLPDKLIKNKDINKNPKGYLVNFVLPLTSPVGAITVKLAKGKRSDKDAIVFEIGVSSKQDDLSGYSLPYSEWLDEAHKRAEDVFLSFVEGELLRSFK